MAYVNFGRKNTRAEALASKNKDKIFFPTDATSIILDGKEYGGAEKVLNNENLNDVITPGLYSAGGGNSVTNKPIDVAHFGLLVVHDATGAYYTQKLFTDSTQYTRKCINGSWGQWSIDRLTDTTYGVVSKNLNGLMSTADKAKLDGIASGATANTGTVTSVSVKMNGATKGTVTSNGTIDLGNVVTTHQDISGKLDKHTSVGVITISGNGNYNFAKLGKFTIGRYDNNVIAIEVSGRGIPFTLLTIIPKNRNDTQHYVDTFLTNNSNRFYIHRDSSTQYSLYVQYSEPWGSCVIHRIAGNKGGQFVVEAENVTALPDNCLQAFYGGNVNYANSAAAAGHADGADYAEAAGSVPWSGITGKPTSMPASDVYSWAKASTKPTYTKSEVGLSNVTNDAQVKRTEMGVANGVATLDNTGRVPSSQLPSYVDDVIEKAGIGINDTGETGKIYVDTLTNKTYRWSGSKFVEISQSLALGETSSTAFAGNRGKALETKVSTLETTVNNTVSKLPKIINIINYFEPGDLMPTDGDLYIAKSSELNYQMHYRIITTEENEYGMRFIACLIHTGGKGNIYGVYDAAISQNTNYWKCVTTFDGGSEIPDWILEAFGENYIPGSKIRCSGAVLDVNSGDGDLHTEFELISDEFTWDNDSEGTVVGKIKCDGEWHDLKIVNSGSTVELGNDYITLAGAHIDGSKIYITGLDYDVLEAIYIKP